MLDDQTEPTFDEFAAIDLGEIRAPTAGAALRRARCSAGFSIADVSRHTRIVERHLEAIERDDYSEITASIYAVGFARSYARFVGIDELPVAQMVRDVYAKNPRPSVRR